MGAWKKIVDYTVPSNTTSVEFTGLNITKDDFIMVSNTAVNTSSTGGMAYMLFPNNETNVSDYVTQRLTAVGSSVSASRFTIQTPRINDALINATSTAFSYLKLSENNTYNIFSNINLTNATDLGISFEYSTSVNVTLPEGVNKLTFSSNQTNGLGVGSRIQIYKLVAEKVADITVTANTTQVDILGLDIKKGDEYLLVSEFKREDNATLYLGCNGDTNENNYWYQRIVAGASSDGLDVSAGRSNVPTFIQTGSTEFNGLSYTHIKLSNIGAFTFQSYGISGVGRENRIGVYNWFVSSLSENITNINQLNIFRGVNNIGVGSRFELYKLYEEGGN